jgi:toxin ParE1/3/4
VSAKRVIRRRSARQDEREAVQYYAREADLEVALRFSEALRDAYRAISDRPAAGSLRYADLVGIRGLRSRRLSRFPFLVFYAERDGKLEVWRILHAQRDMGALLVDQRDDDKA